MNKRFSILLLAVVAFFNISHICGQETFYYKLTKKIQDGIAYTNTAGGQFITFSNKECYDSDKYGISVGNGLLTYDELHSATNTKTYVGRSYFGNVLYRFKADLSILNVIVNNSLMYVYKRQAAPSSVTTCSLIRKKERDGANTDGYASFMCPINPVNNDCSNGSTIINSNATQNSSSSRQQTKHTCNLCHGKKRIVKDIYPALYGTKDYHVKCDECGGYFLRSTGHTHIICPQCHGKGYFTTD